MAPPNSKRQQSINATKSLESVISTAIVAETTELSTAIQTLESNVTAAISNALVGL
jgi:hypothetical protein